MKTRPSVWGRLLRAAATSHKYWLMGEGGGCRPVRPYLDSPLHLELKWRLWHTTWFSLWGGTYYLASENASYATWSSLNVYVLSLLAFLIKRWRGCDSSLPSARRHCCTDLPSRRLRLSSALVCACARRRNFRRFADERRRCGRRRIETGRKLRARDRNNVTTTSAAATTTVTTTDCCTSGLLDAELLIWRARC